MISHILCQDNLLKSIIIEDNTEGHTGIERLRSE